MTHQFRARTMMTALGVFGLCATVAGPSHAQSRYNVVDLTPSVVGTPIQVSSLSNSRQMAGVMGLRPFLQQTRWSGAQLGYLPTTRIRTTLIRGSEPLFPMFPFRPAINALGQIAGVAPSDTGINPIPVSEDVHAAIWNGNVATLLGTLGGTNSSGVAINELGHVTGWAQTANNNATHAFRYEERFAGDSIRVIRDAGTLGGLNSVGMAINSGRVVAGWSELSNGTVHAFASVPTILPMNGTIFFGFKNTDLLTLGGTSSAALGINDNNQIVGYADTTGNLRREAFLCQVNSAGTVIARTSMGFLSNGFTAVAFDINNKGQAVGYGVLPDQKTRRAFVWDATNGMRDLNTLIPPGSGWTLTEAHSINDHGEIAGYGTRMVHPQVDPALQQHSFWLRIAAP